MDLLREYLPATGEARQELVLLHGWASNREIWRPLLARLRTWASVTLLDIPGADPAYSGGDTPELDEILTAILAAAPPQAVYIGWSLGGQLALSLASTQPERVTAVVSLCSNPCFVARDNWPGMPRDVYQSFCDSYGENPAATLQRFHALQVRGSSRHRSLLRDLRRMGAGACGASLARGLTFLQLDHRQTLNTLPQPQLYLLAENDELVPNQCHAALSQCLTSQREASVAPLLPGVGHLAVWEAADEVAVEVENFLKANKLYRELYCSAQPLDKIDVAASFSRSARSYDSVASLQREVGTRLLGSLEQVPAEPERILDLGCGTGYFSTALRERYPQADYIGLDLAQGMIDVARQRYPDAAHWMVGDAESLPLAASSVDLVFSSLAIQWCYQPRNLFAELARVLRPGGRCVFTSLGPETLRELRAAWAAVDEHQHVNTFLPAQALESAVGTLPEVALGLEAETFSMEYPRVRDLLAELKTLGAHNVNRDRPAGLTGRKALQGMLDAYEQWRTRGQLPATYDVLFGVLEKT